MRWKNHAATGCCVCLKKNLNAASNCSLSKCISITNPTLLSLHQCHLSCSYSTQQCLQLPRADLVHAKAMKNGTSQYLNVGNTIMDLYVKNHYLRNAQKLFDEILQKDVRSWTILISGFSRFGDYRTGLDYFGKMISEGIVAPNRFTLSSVLRCCSGVSNGFWLGKAIHGLIIINGMNLDVALANAILDLYVKCGAFGYAERFFETMDDKDNFSWNIMMASSLSKGDVGKCLDYFKKLPDKVVSSWNTVIDGFLRHGYEGVALELLYEMVNSGHAFDEYTFSISLALLASLKNVELGRQVHGQLLRVGISGDAFARTSLVDMYCKCGQMEKAKLIVQISHQDIMKSQFLTISSHDHRALSILWSTVLAGYVKYGMLIEAFQSLRFMIHEKISVSMVTLTSIVTASADAGLLEVGQQIHSRILKSGHKPDVFFSSSMVDMYAKCGKLDDAWSFFIQAETRNVVLWTTMIFAYAVHGYGEKAVQLFDLMRNDGITPNEVTFVGVLTGCSHAGLIQEGCKYFRMMKEVYGIKPGDEHCTSMVDIYGRAGKLNEIKDFIFKNDISHIGTVWNAFLSACHLHKNVEMAKWVHDKLLELQPSDPGPYVLLSNTCSDNYMWDKASALRGLMQKREIEKLPGQSWI
ncbi:unnamed protein product [Coffea canephora]|uniref:Pentacotripeptide-repeat region of PRORP domain-containing protein n=1 Tax=Coffea canephora TaxID=49390 RepID=A0A068U6W2_COFCA|nr:unnamed protein product [Coffea canephora]